MANNVSPITNEPMESSMTLPNYNLRSQINQWKTEIEVAERARIESLQQNQPDDEEEVVEEF